MLFLVRLFILGYPRIIFLQCQRLAGLIVYGLVRLPRLYSSYHISSNLARYDNIRFGAADSSRSEDFGDEVKRRILMGSYALSAGHSDSYYKRAQEVRSMVEVDLTTKLKTYDALLTPAAPTPAYRANEKTEDPLAMFSGDMMTVNVNLCGLPAIVVRGGKVLVEDKLLPVGVQLIGRPFGEATLLEIAHIFELCTWNNTN